MAIETQRTLDTLKSSVDVLSLNNTVVSLRVPLKKTKIRVITKLVHQIRTYRKKTGSEEQIASNNKKCDRLLKEIEEIKKLENDKVLKFALGNTKTLSDISSQNDLEMKAMVRLATHKLISKEVEKWRSHHSDWMSLAAFLMQHTSRRVKKKKKKTSEETDKTAQSSDSDEGNHSGSCSDSSAEGSDGNNESSDDHNTKTTIIKKKKLGDIVKKDEIERGKVTSCANVKTVDDNNMDSHRKQRRTSGDESETDSSECDDHTTRNVDMAADKSEIPKSRDRHADDICSGEVVVKRINLDEFEDERRQPVAGEKDIKFLFRDEQEKDPQSGLQAIHSTEISQDTAVGVRTKRKKRDDFFLGGGGDDSEGTASSSSDSEELAVGVKEDFEEDAAESKMSLAKKKMMVESTFVGCLSTVDMKRKRKNMDPSLRNTSGFSTSSQQFKKPHTQQFPNSYDKKKHMKQSSGQSDQKRHIKDGRVAQTKKDHKPHSTETKKLHPSWEASLRRKQQQSALVKFEGKKIKFDD